MAVPRYRHLTVGELQQLVLVPLMRDRFARGRGGFGRQCHGRYRPLGVSEEVDLKIREQIKAGTFPIRLKPEEWKRGEVNWLLDAIAPTQRLTTSVIANFKQVIKQGDLRIHPLVTKLVDAEAMNKMGASPITGATTEKVKGGFCCKI